MSRPFSKDGGPTGQGVWGFLPWKASVASLLMLPSGNSMSDSWMGTWRGEEQLEGLDGFWGGTRGAPEHVRTSGGPTGDGVTPRAQGGTLRPATTPHLGEPQHLHPVGPFLFPLHPTGIPRRKRGEGSIWARLSPPDRVLRGVPIPALTWSRTAPRGNTAWQKPAWGRSPPRPQARHLQHPPDPRGRQEPPAERGCGHGARPHCTR